ncbi:MAG TPA: hypothetical protein VJ870_03900 [Amycolatopsis sp.]|nr:hypothetical protein [Amycolatopsis sp.]
MNDKPKHPRNPDPPLAPDYPRLHHPDLDVDETKDVDEPANRDDIRPEVPAPEPPD